GHEGSPFGISAPVMLKHRASIACQNFVKYGTHCRSSAPSPGLFLLSSHDKSRPKVLIPKQPLDAPTRDVFLPHLLLCGGREIRRRFRIVVAVGRCSDHLAAYDGSDPAVESIDVGKGPDQALVINHGSEVGGMYRDWPIQIHWGVISLIDKVLDL